MTEFSPYLKGQGAKISNYNEARRIVEKYKDIKPASKIIWKVANVLGVTPQKAREYYNEVIEMIEFDADEDETTKLIHLGKYTKRVKKTSEEIEEDRKIKEFDERIEKIEAAKKRGESCEADESTD